MAKDRNDRGKRNLREPEHRPVGAAGYIPVDCPTCGITLLLTEARLRELAAVYGYPVPCSEHREPATQEACAT